MSTSSRGSWSGRIQFIFSCIGLSVGIGNVWRFPYVAYENGGGTFQLAYVLLLIFLGIPLYFLEVARGQFSKLGPISVWKSCPVAVGIGWAMTVVSIIGKSYYAVILAYVLVYLASSFTLQLPWATCELWWEADHNCYIRSQKIIEGNSSKYQNIEGNSSIFRNQSLRETASQQYWEKYVLGIDGANGIGSIGTIQWRLLIALAITWICVFICMFKGIKSMGKALYVTVILPYLILLALLIKGILLEGAIEGILYFFTPDWEKLLEVNVWRTAAEQVLFSLGIAFGTLTVLGSYNQFHNKCHIDVIIIAMTDFATSLLASMVVFAVLGHLSKELNLPIGEIFQGGQGLAFIIFPEVIMNLPLPQLWNFLFFIMLFMLGINSIFTVYETCWTTLFDEFPKLRNIRIFLYVCGIGIMFCIELALITSGGQYIIILMDSYNAVSRTLLTLFEIGAVMWIYGVNRFSSDIDMMLGFTPNICVRLWWTFVCPAILLILSILSWAHFKSPMYGSYVYPSWAHVFGWLVVLFPLMLIPVFAITVLITFSRKADIFKAFYPMPDWGPNNVTTSSSNKTDNTNTMNMEMNNLKSKN